MNAGLFGAGVCIRRGRRQVIEDQDFAFTPGWTALLGRNGAGKTTLLRALTGVQPLSAGTLTFDGATLSTGTDWRRYRATLGWMPQDPPLPLGMRVSEMVEYAGWLKRISRRDLPSAVARALVAGGATDIAGGRIGRLSGGQKRSVALSCALIGEPRVLLLDEPSVGLDPEQREGFDERLHALGESVAVVYSSHLLEDVLQADRVCVLEQGRVVFSGGIGEFTGHPAAPDIQSLRTALKRVAGSGQP